MFNNIFITHDKAIDFETMISQFESSNDLDLNYCNQCGSCCWRRPCNLVKEDMFRISSYLNISEYQLFKEYLVVDYLHDGLVVIPRRHLQKDISGEYVPAIRTFDSDSPCVFYDMDKKNCSIHDVKPTGGKEFECYVPDRKYTLYHWELDNILKIGWSGNTEE